MGALRPSGPLLRRALRGVALTLIVAGALVLCDAIATVIWQEPVTAFLASRSQHSLAARLTELERAPLSAADRKALDRIGDRARRIAYLAATMRSRRSDGDALARITIPRIGASFVVVDGTDAADLRKGPGFYEEAPLPGAHGTVAIAGHRTTYLAPFRHIDSLRPGDRIRIEMPYAVFTYTVSRTRVVDPSDTAVLRDTGADTLVLTACTPLFTARQRIVVFSRLTRESPTGPGADGPPSLVERSSGLLGNRR